MSTRSRTSHITGLNMNNVDQTPEGGSFYASDGAPGALGGPVAGFSVAVGLRLFQHTGGGAPWIDENSPVDLETIAPLAEIICGTFDFTNEIGWGLLFDTQDLQFVVGNGAVSTGLGLGEGFTDLILLMSYVADDTVYGGAGVTNVQMTANGIQQLAQATAIVYAPSGRDFELGGSSDAAINADPENIGGAVTTQVNSLWVTPSIPDLDDLQTFFAQSMDSGMVIPQAWTPVRTVAAPDPERPDTPSGNYFIANDADLSTGLGGTWVDKIGGAEMTRVSLGTATTPVEGPATHVARQPSYAANLTGV